MTFHKFREIDMKRTISAIVCLTIIVLMAASAWAKEKYTVAVLPFSLHSADNIEYVREGIGDMLSSRIAVTDKIVVTRKEAAQEALKRSGAKDLSMKDVQDIGKKLNADYVVWGSITKIGKSISIDGKLTDVASGKSDVGISSESQTLDDIIPKMNDFSHRVVMHITGSAPQTQAAAVTPSAGPAPAPGTSRESHPSSIRSVTASANATLRSFAFVGQTFCSSSKLERPLSFISARNAAMSRAFSASARRATRAFSPKKCIARSTARSPAHARSAGSAR